jgi:hypothetical protein
MRVRRETDAVRQDPNKVRAPIMCRQLKLALRDEEDQDIESTFKQTQAFLSECVQVRCVHAFPRV